MRIVGRLYRFLTALAPARLRRFHAQEMEDAFVAMVRQARARGRGPAAATVVRAYIDVLIAAGRYRLRRPPPAGRRPERSLMMLPSDIRAALRAFHRQRLSTGLVLMMLSLGIAANVVVFSLVSDLYLKPFPFPNPEELVYLNEKAPRWNLEETSINYPDFVQWRTAARRFRSLALYDGASFNLADGAGSERIFGAAVTHDFFGVLQVEPLLGRVFRPEEDVPKGPNVVIISERLWRDRFNGRADILGQPLRLNGLAFEIIGVLPRYAEFPNASLVWIPLREDPNSQDLSYSYDGVGRLFSGASIADAEQDLLQAHTAVWAIRDKERIVSPFVRPLRDQFVGSFRPIASALGGAVVLLLVVACANVAAVMLARAIARRREMGIRLAIGANRLRLLQQLFVENVLLALVAGAIGVGIGRWALRLLVTSVADILPQWATFAFDWRIALFAVVLTLVAAVLFGWAPALHAVRGDLRTAMQDAQSGGSTVSPRGRRTLTWLVGAQFALAAVLLVAGALLARAFDRVRDIDPGYRPDGVLLFSVTLPSSQYGDDAKLLAFWDNLLGRLRAAPGVDASGIITCPPLSCHWGNFYTIEGRAPLAAGEANPVVLSRLAGAGYFETMGIGLHAGRFFDDRDGRKGAAPSVIVNETFVRTFWPNESSVLGKRLRFNSDTTWITVVGVTKDVKHYGLERPMRPGLYFPAPMIPFRTSSMAVAVRTTTDPSSFAPTARRIVSDLDPELAVYRVRTAREMLADSMRTRATYSWMLAVFAGLTVLLALGGTYGVTSYLVGQRTREIGIRMAMGAQARDIVGTMLRSMSGAIAAGLTAGLAVAMSLAPFLGDLLFGVSPRDPVVITITAMLLAMSAMLATMVPARRAARADPMLSLRT